MNDVETITAMGMALRSAADALDEVATAINANDEDKAEEAMGKYIVRMMKLQELNKSL